jgi:3-oxoacyl-[acyl-carrier protein] reductase
MTAPGRVALIAGASHPFTRAVAVALAEQGVDIALSTSAGGDAAMFAMNSIANEVWALDRKQLALPAGTAPAKAIEQTLSELGHLDLLVTLPEPRAPDAADGEAMLAYIRDRLGGVLLLCQAAASVAPNGAEILNCIERYAGMSSPAAAAAEAGIDAATGALARRLQPRIAVNSATIGAQSDPRRLASLALQMLGSQVSGQSFEI